jgi:hypothetical protein
MARYRDGLQVSKVSMSAGDFEPEFEPGALAPRAGIYYCVGCNHEVAIAEGNRLPLEDSHTHHSSLQSVRWRLLVAVN